MALEQAGPGARRLRRTQAARTLDPSEKGAVSYFLGLAVAKLFADRILRAPYLMHLDVFRPALNPVLSGRSRPDLVGQTLAGRWLALECKGRVSPPNQEAKDKAKQQAKRLTSVNGAAPAFAIGAITYFKGDILRFFWRDPEAGSAGNPIKVECQPSAWRYHYAATLELLQSKPETFAAMHEREVLLRVDEADLEIGIHPSVVKALEESDGRDVRPLTGIAAEHDHYRADGIALVAGESWKKPFVEGLARGETG